MGYFNQSQSCGVTNGLVFIKEENRGGSSGRKENEWPLMGYALNLIVQAVLGVVVSSWIS
ncbi:hypothetical protein J1N35_036399 [Gossypium stocksii]|uniref:Uncharacterized protein n=1 Tax=Gossypium stocksii TaxID=47602 RepID=A0A9D3UIJ5_9ROSI|nr:hypothetical protein J1N35_036399 [Gossypium stocksii]